jgi:hypothetical protein
MAYVLLADNVHEPPERFKRAWSEYNAYLASIASRLPESARAFALADWHYNFSDHRCPHDSWLEDLSVWYATGGERRTSRTAQIVARFLGAYHDGFIEIAYTNATRHKLVQGAGDWLYDEVRLTEDGAVLHEIEFEGGHWLIECSDITARWIPVV